MQAQVLWGCGRTQGPGAGAQRCQEAGDPGEEAEADRGGDREETRREQLIWWNKTCSITDGLNEVMLSSSSDVKPAWLCRLQKTLL